MFINIIIFFYKFYCNIKYNIFFYKKNNYKGKFKNIRIRKSSIFYIL